MALWLANPGGARMRRRRKNATAWRGMFGQFYERMLPRESTYGDASTKWITKEGKPYRAHYRKRRRRCRSGRPRGLKFAFYRELRGRRRKSMVRRRRKSTRAYR